MRVLKSLLALVDLLLMCFGAPDHSDYELNAPPGSGLYCLNPYFRDSSNHFSTHSSSGDYAHRLDVSLVRHLMRRCSMALCVEESMRSKVDRQAHAIGVFATKLALDSYHYLHRLVRNCPLISYYCLISLRSFVSLLRAISLLSFYLNCSYQHFYQQHSPLDSRPQYHCH